MPPCDVEVAIIGAGIAGIAAAYYLSTEHGISDLVLIDPLPPQSFASAQSGENYRDWWPHPVMAAFADHSIDLMQAIAEKSRNRIHMTRRGYALCTRRGDIGDLLEGLERAYALNDRGGIRLIDGAPSSPDYSTNAAEEPWQSVPIGVDVITGPSVIWQWFPHLSPELRAVLHIRRAGDISAQQMGQLMLEAVKEGGGRLLTGRVVAIDPSSTFGLHIKQESSKSILRARTVINAAGPFLNEVAAMLGTSLPIKNVFHQKVAFEDTAGIVPRNAPFSIDLDEKQLDWTDEERAALVEDPANDWLTRTFPGGTHCRPDGGPAGTWIKLGWAYNQTPSEPQWEPQTDDSFPEVVLRGAAALIPGLKTYYGHLPGRIAHYGGYYTMTEENWPLIGPMGVEGAFVVGALSGFGTMAACAAGSLCATWVAAGVLPSYATQLSLSRYEDASLMAELAALGDVGLL